MSRVLVLEDEAVIRQALARLLQRNGHQVEQAGSVHEAEERTDLGSFDLVIADLRLPGVPGTEVISRCDGTPVLIMTSYASVESAVESMKQGAADYISKPFNHDEMLLVVDRILRQDRMKRQNVALRSDVHREYPVAGMIGDCKAMREVFQRVRKVAPTDTTVLVLGESGTGKELVARAIHEQSRRADAPLQTVNCAAIPESLIESELFGHERGAFTGAVSSRTGLVEEADGGTLFLDEVAELSSTAQARLLRVLQHGEIRRVGSAQTRQVDVRLIAATHRDLQARVDQGLFRDDLYFRLRVMEIRLPPLRSRGSDLEALAQYLLEKACRSLNRPLMKLSPDALARIREHDWPGNVRELENALERAVILGEGDEVTGAMLALESAGRPAAPGAVGGTGSLDDYLRHFVVSNQDRMTETDLARHLGISRKTLWEKRQRLGMPRPRRRR